MRSPPLSEGSSDIAEDRFALLPAFFQKKTAGQLHKRAAAQLFYRRCSF